MDNTLLDIRLKPAKQQPAWDDPAQLERVRDELVRRPALVATEDVRELRAALAQVAAGKALVVQSGDCAEDPAECTVAHVARKTAVLDLLAGALKMTAHQPVVRIGRIAGQFAKPRSSDTERVDGVELPVFRGHMVNSPEPDGDSRRPDPLRLLTGYMAAAEIMEHLGWHGPRNRVEPPVWTSHEALLVDYEIPMLRRDRDGRLLLASTHMPWIGERTRQVDGAHVALLAEVVNPVGCKVGPKMERDELLALCEKLDPEREPGRLTLIARMGAGTVAAALPPLVTAVREAGHPVVWLTDPMHGNTVTTPAGVKTRHTETVEREIAEFQAAVRAAGGVAGGLHLETTPDDVVECVANSGCRTGRYTSHCDPRLNPGQAVAVTSAWTSAK
ncbi:3-deoxy-7-phosphoheptulonate synthase [Streptomyces roseirectus]|uniref:Phospho-2-dehydro-3-deoxyheptonate aldolase n=1 Tax=Streptomyces roseirectus TaxID=2768066 RepID=A0A7H0ICC2_9ACTN|nr:3-deoxy-7-phosphoheptulonate synthase [Streptomyces roseirectus]QNP70438.1 3-deoxy-7-phosphoheptulonate synthase [Streptomyces roseirectus]